MRLWHYKLIPYLPRTQLLAQWRELNSIFKKQDKHILINYIYDYPKEDLFIYSSMVMKEMYKRGYQYSFVNFESYFGLKNYKIEGIPFKNHHNYRYLKQCFYNLQEKYDRGQKDFSEKDYKRIESRVKQWLEKDTSRFLIN